MPNDNKEIKIELAETPATYKKLFSEVKENKKADPILDIPKIPFNTTHFQNALQSGGLCRTQEYDSYIDLERLHAPSNKPGSGYGTAKYREIVQRSIKINCPGKIKTEASTSYGSPHLFYLYMGMVPNSKRCSYVRTKYGFCGINTLNKLAECKELNIENIEKILGKRTLNLAKDILSDELQLPIEKISLDDIIKNMPLLLNLQNKTLDYVSEVFIPELLEILASDPTNKHPDTNILGAVHMHLTEEGYARWKYVIDNGLEFVPFKNFEHLNLTPEQKTKLQEILDLRAAASVQLKS